MIIGECPWCGSIEAISYKLKGCNYRQYACGSSKCDCIEFKKQSELCSKLCSLHKLQRKIGMGKGGDEMLNNVCEVRKNHIHQERMGRLFIASCCGNLRKVLKKERAQEWMINNTPNPWLVAAVTNR